MPIELIPNWSPLLSRISPKQCSEFMWMYRENGIEHYKHIVTRLYLRMDGDGRCLVHTQSGLTEVPFEDEWQRVTGRR